MNFRKPPRLASWLLRRTGVATNEPLAGDLIEEFRQGRSAGWYWRQTGTAILSAFGRGFQAERPDIVAWIVGWCLETTVLVIALRLFPSISGPGFVWRAAGLFAIVAFAIYLDYRVRLHLCLKEDEMNDEASDAYLKRWIWTRLVALWSFGAYLMADLIACGIDLLGDRIYRLFHMQLSSWTLMDVVVVHAIWIGTNVTQMAMKAARPKSQNG